MKRRKGTPKNINGSELEKGRKKNNKRQLGEVKKKRRNEVMEEKIIEAKEGRKAML